MRTGAFTDRSRVVGVEPVGADIWCRGIGLHLVQRFRALGEPVIATCRNVETASELKKVEGVRIEQLEVTSTDSCNALFERLSADSVKLRAIVNNAGMFNKTYTVKMKDESGAEKEVTHDSYSGSLFDLTPEVFDQHFLVNTIGPFSVTKALNTLLVKSDKPPVVAHISSIMGSIEGSRGASNAGQYRVSKSALNMVNMLMVSALPEAVCVVLHPGWVKTGTHTPHTHHTQSTHHHHPLTLLEYSRLVHLCRRMT